MVANIDELWIVVCADEHMSEELIERYITLASEAKVRPVLIFTKADIHPVEPKKLKKRFGEITILSVSVVDGTGLEGLRARMHKGSTIALMGSSGVGKSTLVNTLLSSTTQSTGSTRAYDGKGKHTTTYRKLLLSESGASLIDTPGMRALASAKPDDLDSFPDIDALSLQCRFRNCTHVTEPKCAVLQAVKDGKLVDARLKNFIKLQKEQSALPKSYGKKRK
jgi:ribosome biogenesis GTPase